MTIIMITGTIDTQVEAEEATAEVVEVVEITMATVVGTTINDFMASTRAQFMVDTSGESVF